MAYTTALTSAGSDRRGWVVATHMALRNRWCLLAGHSSEDQSHSSRSSGLQAMPGVLAHDCLLLLCWGRQEPGSGSALVWIPERMGESGLEGLSLGSASGVGLGTR